jgi:hypothetical protein
MGNQNASVAGEAKGAPKCESEGQEVIRALVSIDVDLASSLAIRFACQLGGLMEMEINPVYVKESVSHESAVGAGWVSRTWEREMVQEGKKEIAEMIASERNFCPILNEPKVVYGDREAELLRIMLGERFDLFVEGVHFFWNPAEIHKRLHAKFYQRLEYPLVFVRALREVNEVLVLCLNKKGTRALSEAFKQIWKGSSTPLKLVCVPQNSAPHLHDELLKTVRDAADLLRQSGCSVSVDDAVSATPESLKGMLNNYGLVAIAIERSATKDSAEIQWLNLTKTSSFVAFYDV